MITTPYDVDLVLYHGHCFDGFTAAWVAHLARGDKAEYQEAHIGVSHPDVTGRRVAIIDFAYDRDTLLDMANKATSLIVLDHHESNQRALEGLDFASFDMDRSGARMAFDWFAPLLRGAHAEAEIMTRYVQDRDLWQWKLPNSREISAALGLHDFDFEKWSGFASCLLNEHEVIVETGYTILRVQKRHVDLLARDATLVKIHGQPAWICNAPRFYASELGNLLVERDGPGVAAVWYYEHRPETDGVGPDRIRVSLRSSKASGVNVSTLAEQYGGGGHCHAAGFEVFCSENIGGKHTFIDADEDA